MICLNNEQKKLRDARLVLEILEGEGFAARFAGGCVRDRLMGKVPKDYDAATEAMPADVCRIFEQKSYKVIPTGLDHGTVTVLTKSGPVEVTTLRFDAETDGRHATVDFEGATFEDDAARRDFTVNALFEDKSGKVYDYFGGEKDLAQKQLRFVGEAQERIREDYLRILRLFRFWARLDFKPDQKALAAVKTEVSGLGRVSIERIASELMLMLASKNVEAPLKAMIDTGTLSAILAFAPHSQEQLKTLPLDTIQRLEGIESEWRAVARFSALMSMALPNSSAQTIGEHFKLSRLQIKQKSVLIEAEPLISEMGAEAADHLQLVDDVEDQMGSGAFAKCFAPYVKVIHADLGRTIKKLTDVEHSEATKGHLRTAQLPIDGKLLMQKLGLQQGAALGHILTQLKRAYRNGRWTSEAEGLALAKKEIK